MKRQLPHEKRMLDDLKRVRVSDVVFPAVAGLVLLVLGATSLGLLLAGFLALLPLVIRASDFMAVHVAKDYSQGEWDDVRRKRGIEGEERSQFQGDYDYDY